MKHTEMLSLRILLVATSCLPAALSAQSSTTPPATQASQDSAAKPIGPPIRRIESAISISTEPLGAITSIRELSDGRVLVNDGTRRRLLMMDTALAVTQVVLDSLTDVRNAYGTGAGALIAIRADSSLFIDPTSLAMLVLDPNGRTARVRSVPRAENANRLTGTGGNSGFPAFDAKGRLVYRIAAQATFPTPRPPSGVPYFRIPPDSAFIVGIDIDTRKIDTLASIRIQPPYVAVRRNSSGGFSTSQVNTPFPLMDEWAVLSDGTLALIRGRDYRIDWLEPDGSLRSSEKLPFPWVRITPEDKERMVDSMKTLQARNAQLLYTMQLIFWTYQVGRPYPEGFTPPPGFAVPNGLPRDVVLPVGMEFPANYRYGCPIDNAVAAATDSTGAVDATATTSARRPAASAPADSNCIQNPYERFMIRGFSPPPPTYRAPNTIPASELPDYRPPFGASAARADADGNLWIRTIPMTRTPGGPVFDIVNRQGVLVDRIQIPAGYGIAGFGSGKVVYLTMRNASGLHLAKVRLK